MLEYVQPSGVISWDKVVEFNSAQSEARKTPLTTSARKKRAYLQMPDPEFPLFCF